MRRLSVVAGIVLASGLAPAGAGNRLDLLSPDAAAELLADLRKRTHLPVERFEVGDVDLLRDSALITIHWPSGTTPRRGRP